MPMLAQQQRCLYADVQKRDNDRPAALPYNWCYGWLCSMIIPAWHGDIIFYYYYQYHLGLDRPKSFPWNKSMLRVDRLTPPWVGMYVAGSSFLASFSFADEPVTLSATATCLNPPARDLHCTCDVPSCLPRNCILVQLDSTWALILAGALKKFCCGVIVQVSAAAALRTIWTASLDLSNRRDAAVHAAR
jgi:hypothetical protein